MFGAPARVVSLEETEKKDGYQVKTWTDDGEERTGALDDAPPEAFVQRVEHPGGDVLVVPLLEALRAWLKKGREESLPGSTQKNEADIDGRDAQ